MSGLRTTEYGRPAIDALRATVADLKADDPLAPVTILVPNNIAGVVARRSLAGGVSAGFAGIAGIFVTTLPRLAEVIASSSLAPRRPTTSTVLAAAWRAVLQRDPGPFVTVKDHPATIRALSRVHRELRNLDAQQLDVVAGYGSLPRAVVTLHLQVLDQLSSGHTATTKPTFCRPQPRWPRSEMASARSCCTCPPTEAEWECAARGGLLQTGIRGATS